MLYILKKIPLSPEKVPYGSIGKIFRMLRRFDPDPADPSLLAGSFGGRLIIGWRLAMLVSGAGLWLSYSVDLPVGTTVVSVLGALPIIVVILNYLKHPQKIFFFTIIGLRSYSFIV